MRGRPVVTQYDEPVGLITLAVPISVAERVEPYDKKKGESIYKLKYVDAYS
jgi:hypothetical protein